MKYIQSQTSFKAGQLSRTLEGREDIQEYRHGCRSLKGATVMEEGGATRLTGYEFRTDNMGTLADYSRQRNWVIKTQSGQVYRVRAFANNNLTSDVRIQFFQGTSVSPLLEIDASTLPQETLVTRNSINMAQLEDRLIFTVDSGEHEPYVVEITGTSPLTVYHQGFRDYCRDSTGWFHQPFAKPDVGQAQLVISGADTPASVDLSLSSGDITDYVEVGDIITVEGVYQADTSSPLDGINETHISTNYFEVVTIGAGTVACKPAVVVSSVTTAPPRDGSFDDFKTPLWGKHNGWPRYVTTYDGRFIFGSLKKKPNMIVGSSVLNPFFYSNVRFQSTNPVGSFFGYRDDIQNTDPFVFTLSGGDSSSMSWLEAGEYLYAGVDGAIAVGHGGESGLLGPLNPNFKYLDNLSVDKLSPIVTDKGILFMANQGRELHHKFFGAQGGTQQDKLSVLAKDLYRTGYYTLHYDQRNARVIVNQGDRLLFITLAEEQGVKAHSVVEVDDYIYDIAVNHHDIQPNYMLASDDAMFAWKTQTLTDDTDNKDTWHQYLTDRRTLLPNMALDSGRTLWQTVYPEGTKVWAVALSSPDSIRPDRVLKEYTVDNLGRITTDETVDLSDYGLVIGLCPEVEICLMPVQAGGNFGSSQQGLKAVDSVSVRTYKSYSFKLKEVNSRFTESVNLVNSDSSEGYTGIYKVPLSTTMDAEQVVCITHARPEPFTVLSLTLRGQTNDG